MSRIRHRSAGAREIDGLDAVAALRHGRRVARLSQRDLARRAGVSQSLIARIESRRGDPPVGVMQRLLGLCGMRWELRLCPAGATPVAAAGRGVAVRRSARRRGRAARVRRWREIDAAVEAGEALDALGWVSVRERRRRVREARLTERAAQAAAYDALVASDDQRAEAWIVEDAAESTQRFERCVRQWEVPLRERLPTQVRRLAGDDLRRLLDDLSLCWACPPVAVTGSLARAVWSPVPLGPRAPIEFAPLRSRDEALEFLTSAGARRAPGADRFQFGGITVRLRSTPPESAALVRWRWDGPVRAIAVARPESCPGTPSDRHAIRAVLQAASRDRLGRRRPPYHEVCDGSVLALVERFDGCGGAGRDVALPG